MNTAAAGPAHQARGGHAGLQRAGHRGAGAGDRGPGPPAGAVAWWMARSRSRTCGSTCSAGRRLLRVLGPQGLRPHRHRRGVRQARHAGDHAPWQGGGNMIADVTFERTVYQGRPTASRPAPATSPTPWAWARRCDYVERIGMENIGAYEHACSPMPPSACAPSRRAADRHRRGQGQRAVLRPARPRHGRGGAGLNREGIAVRTGHHCAQPILRRFGVEATVRPRWPSTTPVKRWTASSRWCSAWQRPPLKLSAPRSSQEPAGFQVGSPDHFVSGSTISFVPCSQGPFQNQAPSGSFPTTTCSTPCAPAGSPLQPPC
jgi:hypothetical protein